MNKIFFYKNKFYFLSFTVIFLAGLLIISNSNYSYFDYFYLENKYYDFFLGFIFSIFIFAILYKITNNQIILSCWVIKSFFVFFLSLYTETIFLLDKDGYFFQGIAFVQRYGEVDLNQIYQIISNRLSSTVSLHFINYLLSFILPNSLFFFKTFYAFLAFCSFLMMRDLLKNDSLKNIFLLVISILVTINIFTSDINKDVVVLFLSSLIFFRLNNQKIYLFEIIIYIFLLFFLRKWIGIIFIVVFIYNLIFIFKIKLRYLFFIPALFILISDQFTINSLFGIQNKNFLEIIHILRKSFIGGESNFSPINIDNIFDLFFLPIFSVKLIFLPLFNNSDFMTYFCSFENIFIILIIFLAILSLFKLNLRESFMIFKKSNKSIFLFVIAWLCMYAPVISNFGTLIRYKVTFTPFLVLLLFFIFEKYLIENKQNK